MAFKDLFIKSEETTPDKSKKVETSKNTKFPTEEVKTKETVAFNFGFGKTSTSTPVNSGQVSQEHLSKAIEVYQSGFDSLNQPGYDFYEFYQTVLQGGPQNPQTYTMAFTMGNVMDKSVTKEKLLSQSDFYISEITKNYNDYVANGNAKKQELIGQKDAENQSLLSDLGALEQQLEAVRVQIQDRKSKLESIGAKYEPRISEIDSKLAANDVAKNTIVQSIEQVKQGIINNLK